jgi:hypothetical protein
MILSSERQFLERIHKNQHNSVCQQTSLKLTECLCFQVDLGKIISSFSKTVNQPNKKKKRKKHIHWDKYNCGSKNRKTTSDLKTVTCCHCRKSNDFLNLEKVIS